MKTKQFNKRYLDFLKVNLFLMKQYTKEYKVNIYSAISVQIVYTMMSYFILFVIASNFGSIIGWSYIDFIMYGILGRLSSQLFLFLLWGKNISQTIIGGNFNQHLVRPLNVAYKYFTSNLTPIGLLYLISSCIELIVISLLFDSSIELSLYSVSVILFIGIIDALVYETIESFGFLVKKLEQSIMMFIHPFHRIQNNYPIPFFIKTSIWKIFLITSNAFLVLFLFPHDFNTNIIWYFIPILLLVLILILINNWKIGLKKYEAYG